MKKIDLYIVTGFLSTGKTKWIDDILYKSSYTLPVLIQFEQGMTIAKHAHLFLKPISPTASKIELEEYASQIISYINMKNPDALVIEWNGMLPLPLLHQLLIHTQLAKYIKLKAQLYVTSSMYIKTMMGRTGEANFSQLALADMVVIPEEYDSEVENVLKMYRKDIPIYFNDLTWDKFAEQTKTRRWDMFLGYLAGGGLLGLYAYLNHVQSPLITEGLSQMLVIFWALVLQAIPFLLIGIIASVIVQLYLTDSFIDKLFKGNVIKSTFVAVIGGLFLPVCDCAIVPLFHGLVRRKVALPIAITFLLAAPLMNPIVIFATYYAMGNDLLYVASRFGLGLGIAILVGLSFRLFPADKLLDTISSVNELARQHHFMSMQFRQRLSRDYYEVLDKSKWQRSFVHAKAEFVQIFFYFMIGAILAAAFKIFLQPILINHLEYLNILWEIPFLALFGFGISLCATADAFVGRLLLFTFSPAATMAFLLMGPMFDLKNALLLKAFFPIKFIMRLGLTVFLMVILVGMVISL